MRRLYSKFRARVVGSEQSAIKRKSVQRDGDTASASPLLTFVAIALFTTLAIMEIDLHRNNLKASGLISEEEIDSKFVGP